MASAWEEISADRAVWTIPAGRSKNSEASVVPLSKAVQDLLPKDRTKGLVFPGDGGKTFGNWSKANSALDEAAAVKNWRIHDIRRTVATGLQKLGVRLEVTEAILNHVAGKTRGVVGIYQRHDWATEKKNALDGWAAHVFSVISNDATLIRKVVQLPDAALRFAAKQARS